jgi:hypothetical protein
MIGGFKTIAGRWREHVDAAKLDRLPRDEQARAMLMFYAGFAASLQAGMEIADYPEEEAMRYLSALHAEARQVEALAERLVTGVQSS